MVKLQPFIHQNRERINKFMLDLCEVQDFYESLEMDNYVALSKRDLELSITLHEVYSTHGLLEKYSSELVCLRRSGCNTSSSYSVLFKFFITRRLG